MSLHSTARRRRTNRLRAALVLAGAIAFVLLAPGGGTSAAEYGDPCYPNGRYVTHLDPLSPVSDYKTWVFAATDASPSGQVGVCVLALGGQYIGPQYTGDVIFGVGVGADLSGPGTSMTGIYFQPEVCAVADPWAADCVSGGWTGAESNLGQRARVCADGICHSIN